MVRGFLHAELFVERNRWCVVEISLYENDIGVASGRFLSQYFDNRRCDAATPMLLVDG